ncbi:MAG: leucine-rich repeat-containing protein kinase family protein [Cyanobacteriota bacterium]|nr:leucine-rich repeat-containing protein kinase family protein [Cyanobacteriota bacterium]
MTTSSATLAALRSGQLQGSTRLDLACELQEFPRDVFALADTLEILNLSGNALSALPDDLSRLRKLRVLFCSHNRFTELPEVLSSCVQLEMVGFKANRIREVGAASISPGLRWLILTDNQISTLPDTIGCCTGLQKLMLAGNQLAVLPEAMRGCVGLELLRISANRFEVLPEWLLRLPRLTWLAFGGNPVSVAPRAPSEAVARIPWAELMVGEKLGEGASGVIHKAHWRPSPQAAGQPVAVKLFKGAVTSDGLPAEEMAACLAAGQHTHLIGVMGILTGHPTGTNGLVMPWIDPQFQNLANPPDLATCTRDVYEDDRRFSLPLLLALARGLAAVGEHLHARGISHGDFYAHNVLYRPEGGCFLADFGAASFYPPQPSGDAPPFEALEVRAFGVLLGELLERTHPAAGASLAALQALQLSCMAPVAASRPRFAELVATLESLQPEAPGAG